MSAFRRVTVILAASVLLMGEAKAGDLASYRSCRTCHTDIFQLWNGSLHANSFSNPSFKASYMMLIMDEGQDAGRMCLQCHAPMSYLETNSDLHSASAAEGVSCAFCHSIASVNPGARGIDYYHLDTTGTVFGPYRATDMSGHTTAFSPLHTTAALCAGCHDYVNDNGVPILGTITEWKESPYAKEDIHCQNCHMPIMVELSVVDGKNTSAYYVTAHEFQGGHSKINLRYAVNLTTDVQRVDTQLNVTVSITNAESGHRLPTGIPIRKLVLTITLRTVDGKEISAARKIYRKVLVDEYGMIIENTDRMFRYATGIYSDNRIHPKETRVEQFTFDLPKHVTGYKVESVLNYEYSRPLLKEESVSIEMARDVFVARSKK